MDKNLKTILITGSVGLTGSEAMTFFKEKGWNVVGIDNNMRSKFFGVEQEVSTNKMDIRDQEGINSLFKTYKFDAILHCAAQPSHDYSKDHVLEDFTINALGTVILLEATLKYCPNATFVNITTDKVYGENMQYQVHENETRYEPVYPDERLGFNESLSLDNTMRSPFGCSKTASDIYTQEYGRYFGMKTACFRLGCITGKNHKGAELHGFLAYLTKCIKEEKTYKIFGYRGKQVRDQIHAYDLVSACYEFILNPKCGAVYNLGGGVERSVSVLEAIKLIEKETGKKAIVEYIDEPRKGDRIWDIHDVSKFKKHYPQWEYKYSLLDIIKDLCNN